MHHWKPNPLGGTLIIDSKHGYDVLEVRPGRGFMGRGFVLIKEWGGSDKEASGYDVFISQPGTNGVQDVCTCKGYLRHGSCKHLSAMRAICEGHHEG